MQMEIPCPRCQATFITNAVDEARWSCPNCAFEVVASTPGGGPLIHCCRVCGNQELYIQKDFPHRLGLLILLFAFALSCVFYYWHWIVWTWAVLIASVAVDALLYWWVGDVTVCYRCQTRYRGFAPHPDHRPFQLEIGEKYRQERLRRAHANPSRQQ